MAIDVKDKGLPSKVSIVDAESALTGTSISQSLASSRRVNYVAIVGTEIGKNGADFDDINRAIEYASKMGGGHVYIQAGTYVLTEDINMVPGVHLHGNSSSITYQNQTEIDLSGGYSIKYPYTINNFSVLMSDFYNYEKTMGLHSIKFKGDKTGNNLINIGAAKGVYIDGCILDGVKLYLYICINAHVKNCMFQDSYLYTQSTGTSISELAYIIENNSFSYTGTAVTYAIESYGYGGISINNNSFNNTNKGALHIDDTYSIDLSQTGTKKVINNSFYLKDVSLDSAILINAHKTKLDNNDFNFGGGQPNITFSNCDYCSFSHNHIVDYGFDSGGGTIIYGANCISVLNVRYSVFSDNYIISNEDLPLSSLSLPNSVWDSTFYFDTNCRVNILANNYLFSEQDQDIANSNVDYQLNINVNNISSKHSAEPSSLKWMDLTLNSSWVAYGYPAWPKAQCFRDGNWAKIKGLIKNGSTAVGAQITQVPRWLAPADNIIYSTRCQGNNTCELRLGNDRWLKVGEGGIPNNGWLSLDLVYLVG